MPSNVFGYINNYVTINTTQTITGAKTFDHDLICNSDIYCVNLYGNATTATYAEVANNILGGGAGRIPFNTAVSTTNFTERGNVGQLLRSNGSSGPTWTSDISATTVQINTTVPADVYNIPFCSGTGSSQTLLSDIILQYDTTLSPPQISSDLNGNASTATRATNISGGGAGRIPFNTANSITSFTASGTAGQFLTSAGTGTPTWTSNNFVTLTGASQTITSEKTFSVNVRNSYTMPASNDSTTLVPNTAWVQSAITSGNFVTVSTTQTVTGQKTFDQRIIMNGGGNTTTIHQNANFFNISNNVFNNNVTSITGLIPSQNLQCLVRTDSVVAVPGYAAVSGDNITGNGSNNPYFNNLFVVGTSVNSSNISVTALNQINSSETLQPGSYMVSFIGTRFALGTYVTANLGTGFYSISPNALVSFAGKATTDYAYTSLNRALTAAAANDTIVLDYNTTTNLQCLNSSSLMLNAISIKGQEATSKVDIYGDLQLQGSFQYSYGGTISASGSLAVPLSQFYLLSNTTAITITLPLVSAVERGTKLIFKRYVSAANVTFQRAGTNQIVGSGTLTPATSVVLAAGTFQCNFVSAGSIWFQMF